MNTSHISAEVNHSNTERLPFKLLVVFILILANFSRSAFPESIDEAEYKKLIANYASYSDSLSRMRDNIESLKAKCSASVAKLISDSCDMQQSALKARYRINSDSLSLYRELKRQYYNDYAPDARSNTFIPTDSFRLIFAKSGFGKAFSVIDFVSNSEITRIDEVNVLDSVARRWGKRHPGIRKNTTIAIKAAIAKSVVENNIMGFGSYYSNDAQDGTQYIIVLSQNGWRKRIYLSNFMPKEMIRLHTALQMNIADGNLFDEDARDELSVYDLLIAK